MFSPPLRDVKVIYSFNFRFYNPDNNHTWHYGRPARTDPADDNDVTLSNKENKAFSTFL